MAIEQDNVVRVLRREIRVVQDDQGSRLRHIETRLVDLTERVERLEKSL